MENRCYFTMKEIFFSKLLSRCTKERLYYTCMCLILMYTSKMWSSIKKDEQKLVKKKLRKIYGPVYDNDLDFSEKKPI